MRTRSFDIPFNVAFMTGKEMWYVSDALQSRLVTGDGPYTRRASDLLAPLVGGGTCLLTTSCTHALEMAALLLDLEPGDEVVMPSFTFVSTANAFALRGAVPVFVDCRPDTLNLDEAQLEAAITPRTRAIVVVHYGGVACEMDAILAVAERHGVVVVEDNAHGLGGSYRGRPLGSFGVMATQSFHGTKNVHCGEGGALVVNDDPDLTARAEILREKGTNRAAYFRGQVDKYRWVDLGSSYLPSDLNAAVLAAQLESFDTIQDRRHAIWRRYHDDLGGWAAEHGVATSREHPERVHAAHLFFLLLGRGDQVRLITHLADHGILATFHYTPLHSTDAGERFGRTAPGGCPRTTAVSDALVRLPLYAGLADDAVSRVVEAVTSFRPVGQPLELV